MGLKDLWQKSMGGGDKTPDPEAIAEQVAHLRRLGRPEDARQQLAAALRETADHAGLNRLYWDLCVQLEKPQDARPQLLRAIRSQLRGGRGEDAVFAWFELLDRLGEPPIDADLRGQLGEAMLAAGHDEAAAELLESLDDGPDPATPLGPRLRLAGVALASRSANAEALARDVLARPGVPEGMRQELEQALAVALEAGLRSAADESSDQGPVEVSVMAPENRKLKVIAAVPRAVDGERLSLEFAGGQRRTLALRQIQAVAAVRLDLGEGDSFVLIDLLLDSLWSDLPELRTVRLVTRDFDPQALVPAEDSQLALVTLLANLLASSQAQPLPDAEAAVGRPFHAFSSVAEYERRVLEISG